MTALIISDISIRQDVVGRFCLNDFHKASGAQNKQRPSLWLQNQQTVELIEEIVRAGIPALEQNQPVNVVNGGNKQGCFVVKELVYAYAMWISAAFHLRVIRAFDALAGGGQALLPKPAETVTLTKDEFIAQQAEINSLLRSRVELLELKANSQPRRRNLTDDEKQLIETRHAQGVANKEIAEEMDRSINTVEGYLRGLRLKGGAS